MRLVLDTNALIAAFVARGTCSDLLEYAVRTHTVVCSWYILDELREKLVDKFGVTASEARRAAALLAERFEQVEPAAVDANACRDSEDLPILGTAVAGQCTCIVTGDRDLPGLGHYQEILIVSPGDFWRREDDLERLGVRGPRPALE